MAHDVAVLHLQMQYGNSRKVCFSDRAYQVVLQLDFNIFGGEGRRMLFRGRTLCTTDVTWNYSPPTCRIQITTPQITTPLCV